MRDLFDDFMDELRRREAAARGEDPDTVAPPRREPRRVGPDPDDDDPRADRGPDSSTGDGPASDNRPRPRPVMSGSGRTTGPGGAGGASRSSAGRGGPPRTRARGGANDGGGFGSMVGRMGRRFGLAIAALVALALLILFFVGIELWTDALWFQSVGFDTVFWTRIGAQAALFGLGLAIALAVLLGNLWLAGRFTPPAGEGGGTIRSLFERLNEAAQAAEGGGRAGPGARRWDPAGDRRPPPPAFSADDLPDLTPVAGWILAGLAVFVALGVAGSLSGAWETVLLWQNRVPFSETGAVTDPIFGQDIAFFLFELPFLRLAQALFNGLVIGGLLIAVVRYLVGAMRGGPVFSTQVRVHLGVLAALFLVSVAIGYQLDKFELVYSTRASVTASNVSIVGVSFTDQNAQFFAFDVLTVVSALAAALVLGGALTRMLWPLALTLGVWFLASIIVGRVYPAAVQSFTVEPNQYAQEEAYIRNNIAMTRLAFGLEGWEDDRPFRGEEVLTQAAIDAEAETFQNARLWDYRPLHDAIDQLQALRPYYSFTDVDTDRYVIDGEQRQVMLSARELDPSGLESGSWVNERISFTHGIGVAMAPVNEVSNEGQPRLFIRNIPPASSAGVPVIEQPRIYFGEAPSGYVVVGAKQPEFDYPTGQTDDEVTTTSWSGDTGIPLDNTMMRLLFAARFGDLNLLISDQVTASSQLLFDRALQQRLPKIAPFLLYDKDPYVVIDEATGGLVYVQDAYTVSDRFPNANWFDPSVLDTTALGGGAFNYIRNSVKITMNAYDGTMTFYIADPADPIVRTYARVFPTLFRPMAELPASLRSHLRFPEELFNVQTNVFGRYHVTRPLQFFNGDDVWTVPSAETTDQTLPSEAYYVVMRMPGEPEAEFLLLQPMVPTNRANMIAWIAARNDPAEYGTTRVYRFPADTTVFGPEQIEARIDADGAISEQLTLWSQAGSSVIRGNLIVVPVADSVIYLQPFYLQSSSTALPEFQRIVVASPREVVWSRTLGEGLRLLLEAEAEGTPGSSPTPGPSPSPSPSATPDPSPTPGGSQEPGPTPPSGDVTALIDYANEHFELAQQALQAGDFATYGAEMELVEAALRELDELTNSPVP